MPELRVALAQVAPGDDPVENLGLVRTAVAEAGDVDLVVLPEATLTRFARGYASRAEPLDGPFARGVHEIACAAGTVVVAGTFTPAGERVRNTLLVASADGVRGYDKLHLYDAYGYRESDRIEPGAAPCAIEVGGVQVGLATCYDVRFPELFVALARGGARVLVVAAAWQDGPGKAEQWDLLLRARALDCASYVVGVGSVARPGSEFGIGRSAVVAPDGTVVRRLGFGPEVAVVPLDLAAVDRQRAALPVLTDRRL